MTMPSIQNWIRFVLKHPWVVALGAVFIIALMASGASRLQMQTDFRAFFDGDNEQVLSTDLIESTFSKSGVFFIIISPDAMGVVNEPILKLVSELTQKSWLVPYSNRVESLTNFQYSWAQGDNLFVEDLVPADVVINASLLQRVATMAKQEPLLNKRLVSEQQDVTVIAINFQLPDKSNLTEEYNEVFAFVDAMVAPYKQAFPDVVFRYGGDVYLNYTLGDYSIRDMQRLFPLMLVVMVVLLIICYRSIMVTSITLCVLLVSVVGTMGLSGWLGFSLSSTTMVVPVVVMTLAIATAVHIIVGMLSGSVRGSKNERISDSYNVNLKSITISSATTAVGMLTLNFSESPPFRDLGNMVALGVLVTFLLCISLLPALLALLPIKIPKTIQRASDHSSTAMEAFSDWVVKYYRRIFVLTGLLVAMLVGFAPFNDVSDEARKYYKESSPVRESIDYTTEHVSGQSLLDVALFSGRPGEVTQPEFLNIVDDLTTWLRQHSQVAHVYSIADTFKRLNENIHGGDAQWYRIPDQQDLAAQSLLLYEMSLPLGLDLTNQISLDKSATRIFVVLKEPGSSEVLAFEQQVKRWVQTHAPELELHLGGVTQMFSHIGEKNIPAMIKGLVVALLLISVLLIFALRSLKMGAISLIPNLLPIAMGFGFWKLVSGEINMAVSVVASISIGIVVDDTVHFLAKYQQARSEGLMAAESVRYAFTRVGRALVTTSIVLSAGFLMLTLSEFTLLSDMGLLTTAMVVLALWLDFLFLPSLLLLLDSKSCKA